MKRDYQKNYQLLANAIRILSCDAIEQAQSGHPGMPMGMADIATVLWCNHLQHNPNNPHWFNRDRFVLSNGHGSMLLYSLLHLTGYALTIDDIKNFRQLHSKTPGHPESTITDGVETTTGPLGQGLANAVGMALAEKLLAAEFNTTDFNIIDHFTYAFVGDGCLMEGISHEVCSLAGTFGLSKLIVIYDANNISIDGKIENWFTENVAQRFISYNWHVISTIDDHGSLIDGHNYQQINQALSQARSNNHNKPTLIICQTEIGHGAPTKAGSENCHGSPLGAIEIANLRSALSWQNPPFIIDAAIYEQFDAKAKGKLLEENWQQLFARYAALYHEKAVELERRMLHQLPSTFTQLINNAVINTSAQKQNLATRIASQNALNYYTQFLPELIGGSADLTHSNMTLWQGATVATNANNFCGNYFSYGVREFGMCAISNGIYLHGGFRPFAATFLMFSEYARNALRMASLMRIATIFVYSHDSIGLGEDGPTHQPIEQLATLRLIPNMHVWRPCDSVETVVAWGAALQQMYTPSCLVLSRQKLPFIERSKEALANVAKGAYILKSNSTEPDLVIIATGSEVSLADEVYQILITQNLSVQLVAMPSNTIFELQNASYKAQVLPKTAKLRIAIEAAHSDFWYKYVGLDGLIIGIDTFGESAKANDLFDHFGFTCNKIVTKITQFMLQLG